MKTATRTSTGTLRRAAADPRASVMLGDWETVLGPGGILRLEAHLSAGPCDLVVGTLDSPDQGQRDLPITSVRATDDSVVIEASYLGLRLSVAHRLLTPASDGDTRGGVLLQNGVSHPLTLRRGAGSLTPSRPQEPSRPYPYIERSVRFSSHAAGISIGGTLTLPDALGPHPTVILISGSGAQDRDETIAGHKPFLVIADHLTRNGFAVLRTDDRGAGSTRGNPISATLHDLADDVRGALAFLRSVPEVDPRRIGLLGHSEGGYVAPIVAAKDGTVRFVIMMAGPATSGRELLLAQRTALARASGESSLAVRVDSALVSTIFDVLDRRPLSSHLAPQLDTAVNAWVVTLPADERAMAIAQLQARTAAQDSASIALWTSPWFQSLYFHQPARFLDSLRIPVLAIYGARDLQVPAEPSAAALQRSFTGVRASLLTRHVVPDLNHLLQPAKTGLMEEYRTIETTIAPSVLQHLSAWLERLRR
jgi:alpha-beta hydrolase superfamily lysophospholipase